MRLKNAIGRGEDSQFLVTSDTWYDAPGLYKGLSIFAVFYYDIFGKRLEDHIVYIEKLESLLAIVKKDEEAHFSERAYQQLQ